MRFKRKPLAAAILATLTVSAAQAAEDRHSGTTSGGTSAATALGKIKVNADAAPDDYAADVSTIGAAAETSIRDVPQSVTVLNRAVLDAQGATTLGEALRNVPGITLAAGEGGIIGDNINLRGFSARTDLYVDGMRDRGQYSRETFFLDAVEVLKGPSSMLFGRGSTGGVINQVGKQPRLREITQIGLSIGMDSYYRSTADLNRPLSETSAFRITALAHSSESTRDVVESERYGIAPSLRFGIGTPTEVTLSSLHQRRDDIPDYGFPVAAGGTIEHPARPIDADRDNFYGFTDDDFDQDVDVVGARVQHELSPALSLRNQAQFSSARIHAKPTRISNVGARDRLEREIDDRTLYNQTDLIATLGSGAVRHTLVAGAEVGRDDYENQNYSITGEPPQSFSDPVYGPMPASVERARNTLTENTGDTLAFYLNEQLYLGEHWQLIGGVRWDRYEFDSKATDSAGLVTTDVTQTDRMTSVRGGVIYQPNDVHSYYASYGTSFNPSAETLTLSAFDRGVDPEKNRAYELGGKWNLADGELLLTSAVFRVEKTNARSRDPLTNIVTLDGDTRVEGFEAGLSGRITASWQVLAGYTYLDGEILRLSEGGTTGGVRDGNQLANTPEHTASLWSTYLLPAGWEIGGGLVHSSDRILNNANTAIVDGYTRFDATVAYLGERFQVRLNLQNLGDEEYFEVASAGRATPATGRSALATFTWRL